MKFNVIELAQIMNGQLIGPTKYNIENISIDSREIKENSIFVCIVGETVDGHKFLNDVYDKDVKVALISNKNVLKNDNERKDMTYILVDDTIKALQLLGQHYRTKYINVPIIAITGSVGKTSTRELLYNAIAYDNKTFKTPANFNSQVGVPITLCSIGNEYDYAVIETGISLKNEMHNLSNMVRPDVAIITNILDVHIENFSSRLNILEEKSKITDFMKRNSYLVINADDELLNTYKFNENIKRIKCYSSYNKDAYAYIVDISNKNGIYYYTAMINDKKYNVMLGAYGKQQVYNSLLCLACCSVLNLDMDKCIKGIKNFTGFKHRLEIHENDNITIIDDSYNANLASMSYALDLLDNYEKAGKNNKIAIIGDIKELGDKAVDIHTKVAKYISELKNIDMVYYIGEFDDIFNKCITNKNLHTFKEEKDLHDFIDNYLNNSSTSNIIMLKGSHSTNLHKLADKLIKERL